MRSFFFTRKSPTFAGKHTLAKFIRLHGLLNHDSPARTRAPFAQHPRVRPHNHPHDYYYHHPPSPSPSFPFALFSAPYRSSFSTPRPASAGAGNGSAYFIFKAGRIDNLQRRYVNVPSRTRATTAPHSLPSGEGESFRMEKKTVGIQSRIKGSRRMEEAEGFVGARSLGKVHCGTHFLSPILSSVACSRMMQSALKSKAAGEKTAFSRRCMRCI